MHIRKRDLARAVIGAAVVAAAPRSARAAAGDRQLRIGVQKYGTLIILRERKRLEAALAPLGWTVAWTEFPGGPQLLEALNVGAIDFGTTGEAPPIFAQAAGAPLLYVGFEPPSPRGEAILVPKGSPVDSVAALKGKRVALNKGSNVHYLLVRALARAGLTPADIVPIYLPPADARAAFSVGAVDAWAIWDPFLAIAQESLDARVLVDGTGLAPNRQFFLASRAFAGGHPDILALLNRQIDETDRWAEKNQREVSATLAAVMNVSESAVRTAIERMGYGVRPLIAEVVADQQQIADTFRSLGLIPSAVDVGSAVWRPAA